MAFNARAAVRQVRPRGLRGTRWGARGDKASVTAPASAERCVSNMPIIGNPGEAERCYSVRV